MKSRSFGWQNVILLAVSLFTLILVAHYSYLVFHVLVKVFSIVIAFSLFTITWNIRKTLANPYLLLIGLASLFTGLLTLLHMVSYEGMGILKEEALNLAPQFWIASIFMHAITLVVGFLLIKLKKQPPVSLILTIYTIATAFIILAIAYWKIVPDSYVPGVGQTSFKVYSEFVVILTMIAALYLLFWNKSYFDPQTYRWLFYSMVFVMITELSFALFISNSDVLSQIGHYFKLVAFYLLYKANVEEGFRKPAETLYKTIKDSELEHIELSEMLAKENRKFQELNERYKEQNKLLVENELKLLETNATKDRFFSIIAHDLRNIFTPILTYSSLLYKNSDDISGEKIKEFSDNINMSSKKAYKLFENLLEWSRLQTHTLTPNFERIVIKDLFHELESIKTALAELKDIRLIVRSDDSEIYADKEMINTVLRNLVNNAIKFTKPGGRVTLSAYMHNENEVLFKVTDTGIGIDNEHLKKIFRIDNDFRRQGTADEKGTGLGLILSHEFIQKNNGHLWVTSKVNEGSTFEFILPRYITEFTSEEKYKVEV